MGNFVQRPGGPEAGYEYVAPFRQTFADQTQGTTVSAVFAQQRASDMNQQLNTGRLILNDPAYQRQPDYYLNIFSISPVTFVRHRPIDFPIITLAGCRRRQDGSYDPWVIAARVPNVIGYKIPSVDTGQVAFASIRGERFATDLLNPANLGDNILFDLTNTELDQFQSGDDLVRRGLWWERGSNSAVPTEKDVPSEEMIRRIRARMERHYRSLVANADILFADVTTRKEIGAEHHLAASYFGESRDWHANTTVPVTCPNCGEPVKRGIAFHRSDMGICVISWPGAIEAGIKTLADVPESKRWEGPKWPEPVTSEQEMERLRQHLMELEAAAEASGKRPREKKL